MQPGSGVDRAGPKGRRRRTSCRRDVYPGTARCRRSASDSLCRARRGGVQSVLHPNGRFGRSGARRGSDLAGRSGQEFARGREDVCKRADGEWQTWGVVGEVRCVGGAGHRCSVMTEVGSSQRASEALCGGRCDTACMRAPPCFQCRLPSPQSVQSLLAWHLLPPTQSPLAPIVQCCTALDISPCTPTASETWPGILHELRPTASASSTALAAYTSDGPRL